MFCRFGSLDDRRPVAATVWLKLVWTRFVFGLTSAGQRVDVGRLQLGELAVLEDEVDDGVDAAQRLQHRRVGRRSPACVRRAGFGRPSSSEEDVG